MSQKQNVNVVKSRLNKQKTRPELQLKNESSTVSDLPSIPTSKQVVNRVKSKPTHEIMSDLLETLPEQLDLQKSVIYELKVLQELDVKSVDELGRLHLTVERVHDRIDSLVVEQRATNMLLSQLLAVHSMIASVDADEVYRSADMMRSDVYQRIQNGE